MPPASPLLGSPSHVLLLLFSRRPQNQMEATDESLIAHAVELYNADEFSEAVRELRRADGEAVRLAESDVVPKILEVERELVALMRDILDDSKWRLSYESHGVKVSLDKSTSSKCIRIRCEGVAKGADVFGCCASLMEVECYPEWMPAVDEAICEHQITQFRKLVRVSGPKPWPLKRDECLVEAYGDVVDCAKLDNESTRAGVAVYMKPAKTLERTKGRHYVEIVGGWFFEPSPEGSRATLVAMIDPKLRFLPTWASNVVVRQIAYLFIPMVAKFAPHFMPNGKHRDKIEARAKVYDEIQARLDKLHKIHQQKKTTGGLSDSDSDRSHTAASHKKVAGDKGVLSPRWSNDAETAATTGENEKTEGQDAAEEAPEKNTMGDAAKIVKTKVAPAAETVVVEEDYFLEAPVAAPAGLVPTPDANEALLEHHFVPPAAPPAPPMWPDHDTQVPLRRAATSRHSNNGNILVQRTSIRDNKTLQRTTLFVFLSSVLLVFVAVLL